jgi:hypothetical protein
MAAAKSLIIARLENDGMDAGNRELEIGNRRTAQLRIGEKERARNGARFPISD